jgi:hypothetical protein
VRDLTREAADDWQKSVDASLEAFQRRFPDLRCLRCESDSFLLRTYFDETLVPGLAAGTDYNVAELICQSCGLMEKHVVTLLEKGLPVASNE